MSQRDGRGQAERGDHPAQTHRTPRGGARTRARAASSSSTPPGTQAAQSAASPTAHPVARSARRASRAAAARPERRSRALPGPGPRAGRASAWGPRPPPPPSGPGARAAAGRPTTAGAADAAAPPPRAPGARPAAAPGVPAVTRHSASPAPAAAANEGSAVLRAGLRQRPTAGSPWAGSASCARAARSAGSSWAGSASAPSLSRWSGAAAATSAGGPGAASGRDTRWAPTRPDCTASIRATPSARTRPRTAQGSATCVSRAPRRTWSSPASSAGVAVQANAAHSRSATDRVAAPGREPGAQRGREQRAEDQHGRRPTRPSPARP